MNKLFFYWNNSYENDLNYNRRIRLLKLSSLKDEFEHIARKYVQSFYTSQQCPICGCIDS